jgi:hypothetical protein
MAVTIATGTTALGGVRDNDVWTLLGGRNQFESLVTRVKGRSGLGRHDRQDLDAFHVLLDVSAIDIAHDRTTVDERDVQDALG